MKNFLPFIFAFSLLAFGTPHKNLETTQLHSPFRWVFADSAARVAESVTTGDTDKVAYQKSDSSMWVLRDNSPKTWIELGNKTVLNTDSVKVARGVSIDSGLAVGKTTTTDSLSSTKGIDAPRGTFDSLNFGTAGFVTYDSGSFPCTTTAVGTCHTGDGFGSPKDTIGYAYWYRFGKIITIYFEGFQFIVSGISATNIEILNFPDSLVPNNSYSGALDYASISAGNSGGGMALNVNGENCNATLFFHANSIRTYSITNFYATYVLTDVSSR